MDIVKVLFYLNSFPDLLAVNKVTLSIQSTIACPWLFTASLNIPISHVLGLKCVLDILDSIFVVEYKPFFCAKIILYNFRLYFDSVILQYMPECYLKSYNI